MLFATRSNQPLERFVIINQHWNYIKTLLTRFRVAHFSKQSDFFVNQFHLHYILFCFFCRTVRNHHHRLFSLLNKHFAHTLFIKLHLWCKRAEEVFRPSAFRRLVAAFSSFRRPFGHHCCRQLDHIELV